MEGGGGHSLGFVILGVGAHSALFSFLFALCIDISVEDGRDFSGDSVLSLIFFFGALSLLYVNTSCLTSSFPLLPGRCVLTSLVSEFLLFDLSICLLVLVMCLLSRVLSSVGVVRFLSVCFSGSMC